MSRWWLLLLAMLALVPACVVSPTPIPLPFDDSAVAADAGSQPTKDGAGTDAALMPDLGLSHDFSAPDGTGQPDGLTGDGLTGDGLTGDGLTSDGLTSDALSGDGLSSD